MLYGAGTVGILGELKMSNDIEKDLEEPVSFERDLEELYQKQKAIQSEELLKAIAESARSYEEILEFIQGKDEGN